MAKALSQITLDFGFAAGPQNPPLQETELSGGEDLPATDAADTDPDDGIPASFCETETELVALPVESAEPATVATEPISLAEELVEENLLTTDSELTTGEDPLSTQIPEANSAGASAPESVMFFEDDATAEPEIVFDENAAEAAIAVMPAKKTGSTRGRRSLKDMPLPGDMPEIPEDEVLFSKQYYSMGEVSAMFRENQSLIRYWETEFEILQPKKNGKGDRFFRPVDVKNLALIYDLLRRRKFTIEGARDYLRNNKKADEKFELIRQLGRIRAFLLELRAGL